MPGPMNLTLPRATAPHCNTLSESTLTPVLATSFVFPPSDSLPFLLHCNHVGAQTDEEIARGAAAEREALAAEEMAREERDPEWGGAGDWGAQPVKARGTRGGM